MTVPIEIFNPEKFLHYEQAAKNYLTGLNIPPNIKPDFLIATDKSPDLSGRQVLASNLAMLVGRDYPDSKRNYLSFPPDEKPEVVQESIQRVMAETNNLVTILLSGSHPWRFGVYEPIEEAIGGKVIRFGYSPGLTASDAHILEQIDDNMKERIISEVEKRYNWFKNKKSGELEIKTGKERQYSLTINFDMDKAPVIKSTGFLSDDNPKGNIPSGEAHLVPYPFNLSNGDVETTSGLVITVVSGLAVFIDSTHAVENLSKAERELIDLVNRRDRGEEGIPLSELGLGVLDGLGIQPKENTTEIDGQMSILTKEKLRPHLGFGVIAGKSDEEDIIQSKLIHGQFHSDVLLQDAILMQNEEEVVF